MSAMVERVAKILAAVNKHGNPDWTVWTVDARIIIAAMREPTDAMAKAGVLADYKQTGNQACRHIYRAMIDAAGKKDGAATD